MGRIALANFSNVEGLRPVGNTSWAETFASGQPALGAPGSASLGNIQSSALEQSNVDITKELVDMIASQRNFQANAQVVSVADTLTQTIINIRR
jgi:flagellar hook protein FlgE